MLISRSDRGALARWWFTVDRGLFLAALLLMSMGVLISMAASPPVAERNGFSPFHYFNHQLIHLIPAVGVMAGVSFVSKDWVRRIGLLGFVGSLLLMVLALKFGPEIKGAHRWINVFGQSLQPSELAKPVFVVTASWFLASSLRYPDMPGLQVAYGCSAAFLGLLMLQPDFGQTLLVVATFGALLLVYGIRWIYVFGLAGIVSAGVVLAYFLVPHVTSRVDRFLSPDKGDTFQVDTAMAAFHNGGIMGTGPGSGRAKLVLPDSHTDFTFAVVGEEFGLLACLALMAVFFFIVIRVLKRAKRESDPFAALCMTGLVTMFGLQAVINMGVNTALLPAKGMTLPFISYGGSSLVGTALAIGFVLALGRGTQTSRLPESVLAGAH